MRVWLWPNVLSLDAPLVAVLWQILFVRCFHAPEQTVPVVLLAASVWLIYSADRMLDAWRGCGHRPRHQFCRRHWRALLAVWAAVGAGAAWLAWNSLPAPLFARGLWLMGAVGLYFTAVHGWRAEKRFPKEAVVAALFALGATIVAWNRLETAADVFTVLLFSCLCWINCVAIEDWENGEARARVGAAAALVAVAAFLLHRQRPVLASAEVASALAFVLLDRARLCFSPDALRVLADAALLSPLFFLPVAGLLS